MDIQFKQVSSLETIFSYESAENMETAAAFRGERFSYQILMLPEKGFRYQVEVKMPESVGKITVYKLKDCNMDRPVSVSDAKTIVMTREPCQMPDVLDPIEHDNNYIVFRANKRKLFWVRIDVAEDAPVGTYPITLDFKPCKAHHWDPVAENPSSTTLNLNVLPDTLPKQDLKYTQWFYADCIADYYGTEVYSERHWELIENYIKTAVDCGINVLLTPVISPPLDTAIGIYRTNVQLVDIKLEGGRYSFGFDKLDRWIGIAKKNGIQYFEISQLFSQWGLKYTPGIVAEVNGEKKYVFGWHMYASDQRYADFLKQFLPALIDRLKYNGVYENTYFHLSDEPGDYCIDAYKYAYNLVKPLIGEAKIMDALSEYEFFELGLLDVPVTDTAQMDTFIGKDVAEQWSYYAEDKDGVSIHNIAAPPYRNRIIGVQLYKYDVKGFLHWGFNFYNTQLSFHKCNPFLTTSGCESFASGGPFVVYPGADGALLSPRILVFYEALQDIAACRLLESYIGKRETVRIIEEEAQMEITFTEYPHDADFLPRLRSRIAAEITNAKRR